MPGIKVTNASNNETEDYILCYFSDDRKPCQKLFWRDLPSRTEVREAFGKNQNEWIFTFASNGFWHLKENSKLWFRMRASKVIEEILLQLLESRWCNTVAENLRCPQVEKNCTRNPPHPLTLIPEAIVKINTFWYSAVSQAWKWMYRK